MKSPCESCLRASVNSKSSSFFSRKTGQAPFAAKKKSPGGAQSIDRSEAEIGGGAGGQAVSKRAGKVWLGCFSLQLVVHSNGWMSVTSE